MNEDRRTGATRFKVSLIVQGRVPATPIGALLLNISLTGCLVETDEPTVVSEAATILLAITSSITLTGQVAWKRGDAFGVAFHKPLTDETLERVRRESAQRGSRIIELRDGFGRELPAFASISPWRHDA